MATSLPVISPEGVKGQLPAENIGEALHRGFQLAPGYTVMTSPEGQMGVVPQANAKAALDRGFTVGQPAVAKAQEGKSSIGSMAREGALGLSSGVGIQESQNPLTDTAKTFGQSVAEQTKKHPVLSSIIPGYGVAATLLGGNAEMAKQTGQDIKEGWNAPDVPTAAAAAYKTAIHGIGSIVPMVGPAAVGIGEGIGEGIHSGDPNQIAHGVGQGVGLVGSLAMGTKKGGAVTDTAISKIGGGVTSALDATAGKVLPDVMYNKLPDFLQTSKNVGKIEAKAVTKQAANLSSALEMGGKPEKGVTTYEHVAIPVTDDVRTVAAQQGITAKDFEGRNGYVAAEKLTNGVREQYDGAYKEIVDPLRGERADAAAKQASVEAVNKIINDAALMDQLTRSNSVDQVINLKNAIQSANTVGELDAMRIATNRLASKFMGKTEGQQYTSPILQQALDGASDSIRNALYEDIAKRYGGVDINGESQGISESYVRDLQKRHGAAIKADQLMQQTARGMSSVASGEAAGPAKWRVGARLGYRATMGSAPHAAAGVMEKLFSGSDLDLFNTRMKRVLKGVKPDPNASIGFQKPPITPEYVDAKAQGPTGTVPRGYKLNAGPQTINPVDFPQPPAPALPPVAPQNALPEGPAQPLPPHNPARILPIPRIGQKALPPASIKLRTGEPIAPATNALDYVGPETKAVSPDGEVAQSTPLPLENKLAERGMTTYQDAAAKRTIEQAGGKYLGSGSGLAYFNFDDHSTTLAVPDNAPPEVVQNAIQEAAKRTPVTPSSVTPKGGTQAPQVAPEKVAQEAPAPVPDVQPSVSKVEQPSTGSQAQDEPNSLKVPPAEKAANRVPAPEQGNSVAVSFKRENPPQVAQPLVKQRGVTFDSRNGKGDVVPLKGNEHYVPGYEEYRIVTVPPRGNKANHNKVMWESYEATSGRKIAGGNHYDKDEQDVLKQTKIMLDSVGKEKLDQAIQHALDHPSVKPNVTAEAANTPQSAGQGPGKSPVPQAGVQSKLADVKSPSGAGDKSTQPSETPAGPSLSQETVTPRQERVRSWIEKHLEARSRSDAVKQTMDDLADDEADPRPIMREFWEETYSILPDKGKRQFEHQIKTQMGMVPGDTLWVNTEKGTSKKAESWQEIVDDVLTEKFGNMEQGEQAVVALADMLNEMRRKAVGETPIVEAPKQIASGAAQAKPEVKSPIPGMPKVSKQDLGANVISEYHSRVPDRERIVRNVLDKASAKGKPAFAVGDEVYTPDTKYRIQQPNTAKYPTIEKDHDLSQAGFDRAIEQHANLTGEKPDEWTSYNPEAKQHADKLNADRKAESDAKQAKLETERQQRESQRQIEQEHNTSLDQKLANASFKQTTAKLALPKDSTADPNVKGPSIGGLIVHKMAGADKYRNGYDISLVNGGYRVAGEFPSQSDAKLAAARLAELGDWTRGIDALQKDAALREKAAPLVDAMNKRGARAMVAEPTKSTVSAKPEKSVIPGLPKIKKLSKKAGS